MKQVRFFRCMVVLFLAATILALPVSGVDLSGQGVKISATNAVVVGGDKDEHGCIGSAGYTWCDTKQKCLREWEENCTASAHAVPPAMPGSDRDEHGCIGSAGYTWCEAKQKCLRVWEENCTAAAPATPVTPAASPVPATTKSPLPATLAIGALGAAGALAVVCRKDQ